MENVWYAILLSVHNLALVALAGGLFSTWLNAKKRLARDLERLNAADQLIESNVLSHPQGYLRALILLALTGGGLPLVHFLYHGSIKPQTLISWTAFGIKGVLVTALAIVLLRWMARVEIPLMRAFQKAGELGQSPSVAEYFSLAGQRTALCKWGWILAAGVLLATPWVTYFQK